MDFIGQFMGGLSIVCCGAFLLVCTWFGCVFIIQKSIAIIKSMKGSDNE